VAIRSCVSGFWKNSVFYYVFVWAAVCVGIILRLTYCEIFFISSRYELVNTKGLATKSTPKSFRKQSVKAALSPIDNCPAKHWKAYVTRDNTMAVDIMWRQRANNTKAPFTRYNLLSNRLSNPFDNLFDKRLCRLYNRLSNRLYNRIDNRLYRVNGV